MVSTLDSATLDSSKRPHFWRRMWPQYLRRGHWVREGGPRLDHYSWAHRPFPSASW